MDLSYPPVAQALRAELRAWLGQHLTGDVVAAGGAWGSSDDDFETLRAWNATLFDAGWAAVAWPEHLGGRDAGVMEQLVYAEEMARARAPGPVNDIGVANIAPAIMSFGSDDQQRRFLAPMLRGDEVWSQGMSEPDAGSDLASMRTRATHSGDDFVITGTKTWNSHGARADWCQLYARTDPDSTRHRGLSTFLVDMRLPGIEVQPIRSMAGDSQFALIHLDEVRVPHGALLGNVDDGWTVATTTLGFERAGVAKLHAMVRRHLDDLVEVVQVRITTGDLDRQRARLVRDELAQRAIEVECLRLLALRAISAAQRDEAPGPEASLAKLVWARAEQRIADTALRALGPVALGGSWARHACATRSYSIAGGTTEVNKNILGERVLGLPREPKFA